MNARRPFSLLSVAALCLALSALWSPQPARAAGVVGTGSPASCTEAALDTALATGGIITFNCGAAPATIILSFYKQISQDTDIRGAGRVSLSGGNSTPHFQVFFGRTLTLRDITLTRGFGTFGSIQNFGKVIILNGRLERNTASVSGGAIENLGELHLVDTIVDNNAASQAGGGILNEGGTVTLSATQVYSNTAKNDNVSNGHGGGINNRSGDVVVEGSLIYGNAAWGESNGGGIQNGGTLTVTRTTLRGNSAQFGGGVHNAGAMSLAIVTIEDNHATYYPGLADGGGLYNAGTADATRVEIIGNSAVSFGGGVYNHGSLTMTQSTLAHNRTAYVAGALNNSGALVLSNSLVYSNTAAFVGGIANAGTLTLINVTVSENAAQGGSGAGGVQSDNGSATLLFVTITDNGGGGIGQTSPGSLRFKDSIVAGNVPADCVGAVSVTSNGFNLWSDFSCFGNQPGDTGHTNPLLGPLAKHGGPTLTRMPGAGSLAIDGGQCAGVATDQRGAPRPYGSACDIGAVEYGSLVPSARLPLVMRKHR